MPRGIENVPDAAALLCEGCGYVLDGLPADSRCPECGKLLIESMSGDLRQPTRWEMARSAEPPRTFRRSVAASAAGFFSTTIAVIFRPKRFFRSLLTRSHTRQSRLFALIHWALAGSLLAGAVYLHMRWYAEFAGSAMTGWERNWKLALPVWLGLALAAFAILWWTTLLATRLSAWEAAYRGMRLPKHAVLRALQYHAAHHVPVGLLALATVGGWFWLFRHDPAAGFEYSTPYLYILCGEVVVCAAYLFQTYWIAMRNTMYANR